MNFKGIENIISEHQHVVSSIFNSNEIKKAISEIINVIIKGLENNKKILLAGNGGSATDSQHLCSEFMGKLNFDRDSLPAISLMTDTSLISAISNDYSFEYVISRQIKALCKEGDIVILYSTSGNSKNILNAIKQAKKSKAILIGFTGLKGSQMIKECDFSIIIPSSSTQRIQEGHHLINHIICEKVEKAIFKN
ncbi:SIS domain-containing protein [Prochlorococcus sp. AH-736-K09]|nr:SIS domain-containing protein [Prochlorococcus sp. AH-736-K09]